jgi:hypothetical protein
VGRSLLVLASLADNAVVSAGSVGAWEAARGGSAAGEPRRCEEDRVARRRLETQRYLAGVMASADRSGGV